MYFCAGIVLTNDGNAILREIDVSQPAAKVRLLKTGSVAEYDS
jgi:chaperonin GroEL (HSP60 family)